MTPGRAPIRGGPAPRPCSMARLLPRRMPRAPGGEAESHVKEVEKGVEVADHLGPVPEPQDEQVGEKVGDAPVRETEEATGNEEQVRVAVEPPDSAHPACVPTRHATSLFRLLPPGMEGQSRRRLPRTPRLTFR